MAMQDNCAQFLSWSIHFCSCRQKYHF